MWTETKNRFLRAVVCDGCRAYIKTGEPMFTHAQFGVRCETCGKTFVPPRQTCERCFADLSDSWVALEPTGEVTGFTVIRYAEPYQPKTPPYVLAMIKLDGSDTPLAHLLDCDDPKDARIGMRVRAVFSDEQKDNILQIAGFVPADD